jgi:hypothetical protein
MSASLFVLYLQEAFQIEFKRERVIHDNGNVRMESLRNVDGLGVDAITEDVGRDFKISGLPVIVRLNLTAASQWFSRNQLYLDLHGPRFESRAIGLSNFSLPRSRANDVAINMPQGEPLVI